MSELEPFGVAGVGIYALKKSIDGLDRLFGPMADEVADALRRWTAYRLRNVGRVIDRANEKVSDAAVQDFRMPHRAVMKILDEAGTADDEVVRDYIAGVLASSLSPDGRDDRAVTITAQIARLSSFDLRTHFLVYSCFRSLLAGSAVNVFDKQELSREGRAFLSYSSYFQGMERTDWVDEDDESSAVVALFDSVVSLGHEDLIEVESAGGRSHLVKDIPGVQEGGMIMRPTVQGIRLYMWAVGCGERPAANFTSRTLPPGDIEGIAIPTDARLVRSIEDASSAP